MHGQIQNIKGILGPHEVGVMIAIFCLVTIQTFTYYQTYSDDSMGIKAQVLVTTKDYHLIFPIPENGYKIWTDI